MWAESDQMISLWDVPAVRLGHAQKWHRISLLVGSELAAKVSRGIKRRCHGKQSRFIKPAFFLLKKNILAAKYPFSPKQHVLNLPMACCQLSHGSRQSVLFYTRLYFLTEPLHFHKFLNVFYNFFFRFHLKYLFNLCFKKNEIHV